MYNINLDYLKIKFVNFDVCATLHLCNLILQYL